MRLSCNGCRVLRKACSEDCIIRPCLQWIKSPEAQSNATVFLAKFYGRAGLINLITAGPQDLRPAIFRSLLYEACGRVVNPVYGSVGLLWSGNWQMCQAAVEAVLKGAPIVQISDDATPSHLLDIRHVSNTKQQQQQRPPPAQSVEEGDSSQSQALLLHKISKPGRTRFKRTSSSSTSQSAATRNTHKPTNKQSQHDSDLPDHHDDDDEEEASLDTGSHVSQAAQNQHQVQEQHQQLGLDLTLGLVPVASACCVSPSAPPTADASCGLIRGWSADDAPATVDLGFRFI